MIKVSIKDFLLTGEFGPIRLGDSLDRVLEVLGSPDFEMKQRKRNRPTMIEYGVIEFYFDSESGYLLESIYADHFEQLHGSRAIDLDAWGLRGCALKAEIEAALQLANIGYTTIEPLDPTLSGIHTDGGVELLFVDSENKNADWPGLYALSFGIPTQTQAPTKQISVPIPVETYKLIRDEAQRQGTKVAKLCSQWLIEKAECFGDK